MNRISFLISKLIVMTLATAVAAQQGNILIEEVRAIDQSTGEGIKSYITLIEIDDSVRRLGPSNDDGILVLRSPVDCDYGMSLEVIPASIFYSNNTEFVSCTPPEVVNLSKANFSAANRTIENLAANIEASLLTHDYALASLLYNDLAAEYEDISPEIAAVARTKSSNLFAESINFQGEVLRGTRGTVLTAEFSDALSGWQLSNGVATNGVLDYETLAVGADKDVGWFRHSIPAVISSIPSRNGGLSCTLRVNNRPATIDDYPNAVILADLAEDAENNGNIADASIVWSDLAYRYRTVAEVSQYAEQRVYTNVGNILGDTNSMTCDPIQQKFVLSDSVAAKVVEANMANGVSTGFGVIDYNTIMRFGARDFGTILEDSGMALNPD